MMIRALTLAGGLAGAATTSQLPEFSQQYVQRLGGAVDALFEVVADFDSSAQAVGLTRDAALGHMQGSEFLDRRRRDMTQTFERFDALQRELEDLRGAGPFMRAYHLAHLTDAQIARAAWQAYEPAVPLNFAGMTFAGGGFILATILSSLILSLLAWPFRRRRRDAANAA